MQNFQIYNFSLKKEIAKISIDFIKFKFQDIFYLQNSTIHLFIFIKKIIISLTIFSLENVKDGLKNNFSKMN